MPWREKKASERARVSLPAERFVTPVPLQFLRSELPARLCFCISAALACLHLSCSAEHQLHAATVALHFGIVRIPSRSFRPQTLDEPRRRHDGSDERPDTLYPPPTHPHPRTHAFARLRTILGRSDAAVQHTTTFAPRDGTAGSIPLTTPPRPPDSLACLTAPPQ